MKKEFQNAKLQVKMKGADNPEGVNHMINNVVENPTEGQIAIIKDFLQTITNNTVTEVKQTVANKLNMNAAAE